LLFEQISTVGLVPTNGAASWLSKQGGIDERLLQVELALFVEQPGQQAQSFFQPAGPNPLPSPQ
jgi:hypothetical protein